MKSKKWDKKDWYHLIPKFISGLDNIPFHFSQTENLKLYPKYKIK